SRAASAFSSRKAVSGSTSRSMRSRAVSFPRDRCRSTAFSPPPRATCAVRSRSSATSAVIRSCRRAKSAPRSTCEVRTATARSLSAPPAYDPLGRALQQLSVPLLLPTCGGPRLLRRAAAPAAAARRDRGVVLLLRVRRLVVPRLDGGIDGHLVHRRT